MLALEDIDFLVSVLELPGKSRNKDIRQLADAQLITELKGATEKAGTPLMRRIAVRIAGVAVPEGDEFKSVLEAVRLLKEEVASVMGSTIDDRSPMAKHWQEASTSTK